MKKVQQDVMCVLLQTLLDRELITKDIFDKSRDKILGALDLAEPFFHTDDRKENQNGHP